MKKVALIVGLMAAVSYAAPAYTMSWDFEDGTVGNPHGDWSAGSIQTTGFGGAVFSSQRLFTGDNTSAWANLPQATNSFIYTANVRWDAGSINGLRKAGIGYGYAANSNQAWFEGRDTNWPVQMIFGDPYTPSWPGGSGAGVYPAGLGDFFMAEAGVWELPDHGESEFMVKYNTPDNPGTVELYWRSLTYDNVRVAAGEWLNLTINGDGSPISLSTDPNTGEVWAIDQIKVGGDFAWSQCSFDNITFQSVPEPTTLALLAFGGLFVARRRR